MIKNKPLKIVSLFDGMACGMLAMLGAGADVGEYYAYEIDKYAVQTATHNFPNIIECGDVFKADFTQYKDVDFIVGGSPCTYWSIAQKNNRETEASGLGWELFSQYVRALNEIKPRFFIYENNKSMSKAIRESITEAFGFDAICINSALVSAQNRQRLYWVGKRNDDGTYSKVDVQQPEDRGILLRDILDSGMDLTSRDKSFAYTTRCNGAIPEDTISRNRHSMVAELVNQPIGETKDGKSYCLTAGYSNGSGENIGNYAAHTLEKGCKSMVAEPVNTTNEGKAQCIRATCYKDGIRNMVGNDIDKRTCVAEAVNTTPNEKSQTIKAQYQQTSVANICKYTSTYGATGVAEEVADSPKQVGAMPVYEFTELNIRNNAHIAINENAIRGVQDKNNASCAENFYEFTDRKANTLTTAHVPKVVDDFNKYSAYAEPCEWDDDGTPTKAISSSDGKTYTVYSVLNGIIVIKGKEYPIKLQDGYYIIRKLSVNECKRLQTVPEWYEFKWRETEIQNFGDEVSLCKSAKLKDAISQLQAKKLAYATNIICGSSETELRNLVENMLTTVKLAKKKGATENVKHYKVTVSNIIKNGNVNNQSTKQKNALCVVSQSGIMDATGCVLNITLNGSEQETLCIEKKDNLNLMGMMDVNTTKHLTEDGFIELLQKKFSEENSLRVKLFIISILTNWIIVRTIYMFATTKPISVCIDSLSDWQPHCLKMELLSLKMENIGGMSNSSAYKMLGNGWTVEVIVHLIKSCLTT